MKLTDLEIAIVNHFNPRTNIIVPNVSWGWDLMHEADLIVVSKAKIATEIELKISVSDIKKDAKKRKWRYCGDGKLFCDAKISKILFALPASILEKAMPFIPEFAGILSVGTYPDPITGNTRFKVKTIRGPKLNQWRKKLNDSEILKLMRLGVMRIWTLKKHIMAKH